MMELFTVIARRDYKSTVHVLNTHFDTSMAVFNLSPGSTASPIDQAVATKRLIWTITMMAAGLNGHSCSKPSDAERDELADGQIAAKIFRLMAYTDDEAAGEGNTTNRDVQLEHAYLYAMEQFRKAYLSDSVHRESKVFVALTRELGVTDENKAMEIYARKMWVMEI
jgi:hypothetical protein